MRKFLVVFVAAIMMALAPGCATIAHAHPHHSAPVVVVRAHADCHHRCHVHYSAIVHHERCRHHIGSVVHHRHHKRYNKHHGNHRGKSHRRHHRK